MDMCGCRGGAMDMCGCRGGAAPIVLPWSPVLGGEAAVGGAWTCLVRHGAPSATPRVLGVPLPAEGSALLRHLYSSGGAGGETAKEIGNLALFLT
jgi:hypothetical protein